MGISYLKSAIFIVLVYISVYRSSRRCAPQDNKIVISSDRRESRDLNHANIQDPGHKKGLFSGQRSHFPIRGQENGRFSGREMKIQNDLTGGQLNYGKAVR